MISYSELYPSYYPESKYEGCKYGAPVVLDNTLYMVFVYEDGDILYRELLKDVKQYLANSCFTYALLRTNGDLYILGGYEPYHADTDDYIRLDGDYDELYAFTRTGLKIFTKDRRKITFEYGVVMDDALILNERKAPFVVSIAHGDILIGFKNMRTWWNYDTKGVWYKRFSKREYAITDVGVVLGGKHYIFNEEPKEVMHLKNRNYVLLFKDRLQVLTLKDDNTFSLGDYPFNVPIYDIDIVGDYIVGKVEDRVNVITLGKEEEYKI